MEHVLYILAVDQGGAGSDQGELSRRLCEVIRAELTSLVLALALRSNSRRKVSVMMIVQKERPQVPALSQFFEEQSEA